MHLPVRLIAWAALVALLHGTALAGSISGSGARGVTFGATTSPGWQQVKVGGGGYITGIDISPDGNTRCVRADTYGAYCWDTASSSWQQVMRASNMPAGNVSPGGNGDGNARGGGVYEIRSAPSLSSRVYMVRSGSVFRSDDRAAHWSVTGFTPVTPESTEANDGSQGQKYAGQKLAVDPSDPNVVLVGTIVDGLWRTVNGGTSWAHIASVPNTGRIAGIAFGTGGTVWLGSTATAATGVYKSTDNGATFSLQTGGPNGVAGGAWAGVASGTTYWTTWGAPNGSPHKTLWMNAGGSWTDCTPTTGPNQSPLGLSINAAGTRIAIAVDGNSGNLGGVQFGPAACSAGGWDTAFTTNQETYPNAPWLASTVAAALLTGGGQIGINKAGIAFDPSADRLWVTSGVGMWYVPASEVAPMLHWTESVKGIENLVTNEVMVAPNGADVPLLANWDFGHRRSTNPGTYQTASFQPGTKFTATWSFDYASSDPNFIVAATCYASAGEPQKSTDNGATWAAFPTLPPGADNCDGVWGGKGGVIAAATPSNWIWVTGPGGSPRAPYYTLNGGTNWSKLVLPSPMTDDNDTSHGWLAVTGFAQYLNRSNLTADRVAANTFYLYVYAQGVLRSTDGGANWTWRRGPGIPLKNGGGDGTTGFDETQWNAKMAAVPGKEGHLFFTSGQQDGASNPSPSPLYRSTDGGATWAAVTGTSEIITFGFGKEVAQGGGGTYPTLLIVGWYNSVFGIWKSTDNAASWTKIPGSNGTDYPLDSFDNIGTIDGDKTGDRIFIGFRGSGSAYFQP